MSEIRVEYVHNVCPQFRSGTIKFGIIHAIFIRQEIKREGTLEISRFPSSTFMYFSKLIVLPP